MLAQSPLSSRGCLRLGLAVGVILSASVLLFLSRHRSDGNTTRLHYRPSGIHTQDVMSILAPLTLQKHETPDSDSAPSDLTPRTSCPHDPVTRTLSDGNANRYAACGRIFYNRVPKCGSRTTLNVIRVLAERLNYTLITRDRPNQASFYPTLPKLMEFADEFSQMTEPFIYAQHLHFVNFTELERPAPIFFNIIRNPTERLISHYFFSQFGSSRNPTHKERNVTFDDCVKTNCRYLPKNHVLPYFCGQHKLCRMKNAAALQIAKNTLSSEFLVVGQTENLPQFVEVLEFLLPQFFSNATAVFNEIGAKLKRETQTSKKTVIKPETRARLKNMLHLEHELYEFAKQRFDALYAQIRELKARGHTNAL